MVMKLRYRLIVLITDYQWHSVLKIALPTNGKANNAAGLATKK